MPAITEPARQLPIYDNVDVVVETKSGRQATTCQVVIDATGDADVAHRAGLPTIQGRDFDHMAPACPRARLPAPRWPSASGAICCPARCPLRTFEPRSSRKEPCRSAGWRAGAAALDSLFFLPKVSSGAKMAAIGRSLKETRRWVL